MIICALDGLLFLMIEDFFSIGFHIFTLFFIFGGLKAKNRLNQINNEPFTSAIETITAKPSAFVWLQSQEQRESRRRILRALKIRVHTANSI
jgi:hypothetical protein